MNRTEKKRGYGNVYFIVIFTTVKRYTHPKRAAGENPPNVNNSVSLWLVELWVIFSSFFIFSVFSKFSLKVTNYFQEKIYTDPSPHSKILTVSEEQHKGRKTGWPGWPEHRVRGL